MIEWYGTAYALAKVPVLVVFIERKFVVKTPPEINMGGGFPLPVTDWRIIP